jgi:hypothetical protein
MESMRQRRQLSADQELDLWLGPYIPDAFASDDERRAAWFRDRDRVAALFYRPGRRLMAWWQYEAPIPWPGLERQASALYEAGLLGESERLELEAEWRREFARGETAEIPRELVKQWKAERRRQVKTIRKLEAAAAADA